MTDIKKSAVFLLLLAATLLLRYWSELPTDVVWLLTVAERVLDGETLYVDILESNPPFSTWLYMVPVMASRLIGLTPEIQLYLLVAAASCAVMLAFVHISRTYGLIDRSREIYYLLFFVAIFVLLPYQTFAQRDVIGVILLVPWLSVQAVRMQFGPSARIRGLHIALAALSGAIFMIIKPHYILTLAGPVLAMAIRRRSIAPPFHLENLLAAAITFAYGLYFILGYPEFFNDMMPIVMAVYLPVFNTGQVLLTVGLAGFYGLLVAIVFRDLAWPAMAVVAFTAAIGHLVAVVIMGKGFGYQVSPAMILLGVAAVTLLAERIRTGAGRADALVGAVAATAAPLALALSGVVAQAAINRDYRDLASYLETRHRGDTVAQVTLDLEGAYVPFNRAIAADYTSPLPAMIFTIWGYQVLGEAGAGDEETRKAVLSVMRLEEKAFGNAILKFRPDIVLVSDTAATGPESAWDRIRTMDAGDGKLVDHYALETKIGDIAIYRKR